VSARRRYVRFLFLVRLPQITMAHRAADRAEDLVMTTWTRVPVCVRRIANRWPGEVAC
jgi:hypothetical protein